MTMTIKAAKAIAGSLGDPSKMPGRSYGLPAGKAPWVPDMCETLGLPVPMEYGCRTGGKLMDIAGSTCSACYAQKANYRYSSVRHAQTVRLVGVSHPKWVDAMVTLINRYVSRDDAYFRWHDSGDLLGEWHLQKIIDVANRCPWVQFWLPTREGKLVADFENCLPDHFQAPIPANLTIRVSATKVDGNPGRFRTTSTVHKENDPIGWKCPAPTQNNECGDCRACWSDRVENVSYHIH